MTVQVMVFGRLHRAEDRDVFEAAIKEVSSSIKGTTGYIKDELLRDPDDLASYILMSEWTSGEEFLRWEQSSIHKQSTVPLRSYWRANTEFKIYNVAVRLDEHE
jgi:heme-degrading monooxygenase HmoA